MKPAFIVTVHKSEKYRPRGHEFLDRYISSLEECLQIDYDLFVMENASESIYNFPKQAHYRYFPDQLGGMTRCWNEGVKYAVENGNDFLCVTNEDLFFNNTINNFFSDIEQHEFRNTSVYGPLSDCPTTFISQRAKAPSSGFKDVTRGGTPIHGWFLSFSKDYFYKFKDQENNIFNKKRIWRGQEGFQQDNRTRGSKSFVVNSCLVHHDHTGSWRKTIFDIKQTPNV